MELFVLEVYSKIQALPYAMGKNVVEKFKALNRFFQDTIVRDYRIISNKKYPRIKDFCKLIINLV